VVLKGAVVVERRPAEELRTRADRSERGRRRTRRGEGRRQRLRGSGTCGCSPARAAAPLRRRGSLPCSCGCSPARLGYHAAAAAARSPVSGMEVSRSTDQNLAFFAVYNMETTDIVSLYQVLTTMEIDLHIASYLLNVLSLFYKFSTEFIGGALFLV